MSDFLGGRLLPILLLCVSNIFMTFAWYGHLKFKQTALWKVIFISWVIAFFEYLVMVPANRLGSAHYSTTELKIIQEVVTLVIFSGFVILFMGERMRWNHFAAFLCILAAVAFTFLPKN